MVFPNMTTPTVRNVVTPTVPLIIIVLPADAHAHAVAVQGCRFGKITNIEFYRLPTECLKVLNTKIKPLVVALRVGVHSHKKVVFEILCFQNHVKIARFEK